MYEVTIKKCFSAAHLLKEIGGKCEELHGHNFVVEISVASSELNREGILIDFKILEKWTDEVIKDLDHKYINDIIYFDVINPSSEFIAKFIYDRISKEAHRRSLKVSCVTVWESENSRASYYGNAS